MSAALIASVRADLIAKIASTDNAGAAAIYPSVSFDHLLEWKSEGQLPAVGVRYSGYSVVSSGRPLPVGNGVFLAETRWEISVLTRAEGDPAAAQEKAEQILELARARVNGQQYSVLQNTRYLVESEEIQDIDHERVGGNLTVIARLTFGTS